MGKGVTSSALAALLNIVHTLMDLCQVDLGDVVAMVTQREAAPDLAWLSSCLQDRDVAVSTFLHAPSLIRVVQCSHPNLSVPPTHL